MSLLNVDSHLLGWRGRLQNVRRPMTTRLARQCLGWRHFRPADARAGSDP